MDHGPPSQHWGPTPQSFPQHAHAGPGYGTSPHFMPPRQFDNYYPPADMPPPSEKQPHHGISAYGREAPMSMHSSASQAAPSVITQVTLYFLNLVPSTLRIRNAESNMVYVSAMSS